MVAMKADLIFLFGSLLFLVAAIFMKKKWLNVALNGVGMAILLGLMIRGTSIFFSYTTLFSLLYGAILLYLALSNLIDIKREWVRAIARGVPSILMAMLSAPAIYIYGVQGDHFREFVYVALGIGAASLLIIRFVPGLYWFKGKHWAYQAAMFLFLLLGVSSLSYSILSTIQSRYLLFFDLSLAFAIASAIFEGKPKPNGGLSYLSMMGATAFVIAPLIF